MLVQINQNNENSDPTITYFITDSYNEIDNHIALLWHEEIIDVFEIDDNFKKIKGGFSKSYTKLPQTKLSDEVDSILKLIFLPTKVKNDNL